MHEHRPAYNSTVQMAYCLKTFICTRLIQMIATMKTLCPSRKLPTAVAMMTMFLRLRTNRRPRTRSTTSYTTSSRISWATTYSLSCSVQRFYVYVRNQGPMVLLRSARLHHRDLLAHLGTEALHTTFKTVPVTE